MDDFMQHMDFSDFTPEQVAALKTLDPDTVQAVLANHPARDQETLERVVATTNVLLELAKLRHRQAALSSAVFEDKLGRLARFYNVCGDRWPQTTWDDSRDNYAELSYRLPPDAELDHFQRKKAFGERLVRFMLVCTSPTYVQSHRAKFKDFGLSVDKREKKVAVLDNAEGVCGTLLVLLNGLGVVEAIQNEEPEYWQLSDDDVLAFSVWYDMLTPKGARTIGLPNSFREAKGSAAAALVLGTIGLELVRVSIAKDGGTNYGLTARSYALMRAAWMDVDPDHFVITEHAA